MLKIMKQFLKDEQGNFIEYLIVLAVVAVIVAAMFPALRNKIVGWFENMTNKVDVGIGSCSGSTSSGSMSCSQ